MDCGGNGGGRGSMTKTIEKLEAKLCEYKKAGREEDFVDAESGQKWCLSSSQQSLRI